MELDNIIELNEGLIYSCMQKFYNVDKEDLYQAGLLGLIKAYRNYHYDGKTKFSSYAYKYIFGEMYLLVNAGKIKISRDILKLSQMIEKTRYALAQKINHIPSNQEIANFLHIPIEKINDAQISTYEMISLDKEENYSLYETIGENNNYDDNIWLMDSLKYLNDEEKQVIMARYYDDLTQMQAAKKLSMSQVKVCRYEKRSLEKLRDYMNV